MPSLVDAVPVRCAVLGTVPTTVPSTVPDVPAVPCTVPAVSGTVHRHVFTVPGTLALTVVGELFTDPLCQLLCREWQMLSHPVVRYVLLLMLLFLVMCLLCPPLSLLYILL